jgi:SOUL heme-binding protein
MDTPLFVSAAALPTANVSLRGRPLTAVRAPRRRWLPTTARAATMRAGDGDAPASWREELRMLLDPTLGLGAKTVLLQDLAKRAPQVGREAFEDVCGAAGLDGIPEFVTQVNEDVLPDLARNGGRYVGEFGRRVPDAAAAAAESMQSGGAGFNGGQVKGGSPAEVISAVGTELRNVFNRTPEGVETPAFEEVGGGEGYRLRRYPTMDVAEADMVAAGPGEVDAAAAMGDAFGMLAQYLFGANASGGPLAMTTPVVVDYAAGAAAGQRMSFVLQAGATEPPAPVGPAAGKVRVATRQGGVFAVREFSGLATAGAIARAKVAMFAALRRDGVAFDADRGCAVLIYNGPQTLVFLRRNEVLVRVSGGEGSKDGGPVSSPGDGATADYLDALSGDVYVDVSGTTD